MSDNPRNPVCVYVKHGTERENLCSPTWQKRYLQRSNCRDAKPGSFTLCRSFGTRVEETFRSRGLASPPPYSLCSCACQAELIPLWLLPGFTHKPPQTGMDQEARPLPALAAQGWPFPSNSTIPPLPSGTCPDTFALNRIACKSLGLPTHVKGTAGGKKQGKPATVPAWRKRGAISRAQRSVLAHSDGCEKGTGCWGSNVYPGFSSSLHLTFSFQARIELPWGDEPSG